MEILLPLTWVLQFPPIYYVFHQELSSLSHFTKICLNTASRIIILKHMHSSFCAYNAFSLPIEIQCKPSNLCCIFFPNVRAPIIIFSLICILFCIFFSSQGSVLYSLDKYQNLFVAEIFVLSLCAPATQVLSVDCPLPRQSLPTVPSSVSASCTWLYNYHSSSRSHSKNTLQGAFHKSFPGSLPCFHPILVRLNTIMAPVVKMHCLCGII